MRPIEDSCSEPYVCSECGGPAKWTLIAGEVFYSCLSDCEGFRQGALDWMSISSEVDRVGSVSALEPD